MRNDRSDPVLISIFDFSVLKMDKKILDPANTNTVYEYYLLENLAAGLVRDDVNAVGGFAPILAKSWTREGLTKWRFTLRENLLWSDGTQIDGAYIAKYFLKLKSLGARHLVYLRQLQNVEFEPKTNELVFHFLRPVGFELLNELSLADAGLLSERNGEVDWAVTSGPYFVAEYNWEKRELELKANLHCPLVSTGSPQRVLLRGLYGGEKVEESFDFGADIVRLSAYPFLSALKTLRSKAPVVYDGVPNLVYYFEFNPSNALTSDESSRVEFASLVREVFSGRKLDESLSYYDQMIPVGYAGHLLNYRASQHRLGRLKGKVLTLQLPPSFEELRRHFEDFVSSGARQGLEIKLKFSSDDGVFHSSETFARLSNFKGNQKDPIGSWSFLLSDDSGSLTKFEESLVHKLEEAAMADSAQRESDLEAVHATVLNGAYLVPFQIVRQSILASNRVDLSRWNRFDLRLRYYDVRWK